MILSLALSCLAFVVDVEDDFARIVDTVTQPDSQAQVGLDPGSFFGETIAADGDFMVVGEPGYSSPPFDERGRIVLMRRDVRGQWSTLITVEGQQNAMHLGTSVAIAAYAADDVVVVAGAPDFGYVRVLRFDPTSGTSGQTTLQLPQSTRFGASVATNGTHVYVGMPGSIIPGVAVYNRATGSAATSFLANLGVAGTGPNAELGAVIAASGNRVVASARGVADGSGNALAHVFRGSGTSWVLEWTLSGPHADGFARSLAIDGSKILVGAPERDDVSPDVGAVHVFRRIFTTQWELETIRTPFELSSASLIGSPRLGASVALEGSLAVYGVPGVSAAWEGGVILDDLTDSPLAAGRLCETPSPLSGHTFGAAVSIANGFVVVGHGSQASQRGAVYAYQWNPPDCNGDSYGDLYDIESGLSPDVDGNGVPDECETPPCTLDKLVAGPSAASDFTGYANAVNARWIVTGAYADDVGGAVDAGSALAYARVSSGSSFSLRLVVPTPVAGDNAGHAVALVGDVAFVGAPGDDDLGSSSGSVHVFHHSGAGWSYAGELHASDGNAGDSFGATLAVDAGVLYVGAPNKEQGAVEGRGSVYAYDVLGTTTTLVAVIPSPGVDDEAFGAALDARDDVLAVGVPYAKDAGTASGAFYAFRRVGNVWFIEARHAGPAGSKLGSSVAVGADRIAAGSPERSTWGALAGGVSTIRYVPGGPFWSLPLSWRAPGTDAFDHFGAGLEFVGDRLLVGAPFADTTSAGGAGAVHVMREYDSVVGWAEIHRFAASDGVTNQAFGRNLAWSDSMLVVGAHGDDVGSTDTGSAYSFGLGGEDCNANVSCDLCEIDAGNAADANQNGAIDACELVPYCFGDGSGTPCPCGNDSPAGSMAGCLSSFGLGGKLASSGVASIGADTFQLLGSQMPNSSCLFYQGTAQVNGGAGTVWGDGLRCAGGSVLRLGNKAIALGLASYPAPGDTPISIKGAVSAPGWRYYSIWYRNSATFCTPAVFNYTNGLAVRWSL